MTFRRTIDSAEAMQGELQAFSRLVELAEDDDLPLPELYQSLANQLAECWPYSPYSPYSPDEPRVAAQIVIDAVSFSSPCWVAGAPALRVPLHIAGRPVGSLALTPAVATDKKTASFLDLIARQWSRIFERRARLDALRASEELLGYVLAATEDAIWDLDQKSGMIRYNRRWCEMMGFPDEIRELSLDKYFALIHPDERCKVQAQIQQSLYDHGSYAAEYRFRRADGTYLWIADHGSVVERDSEGRAVRFVGAFTDVTARKRAEQALLESEQRLRLAQEAASVGVWDIDVASNRVYWSPECARLYGVAPSGLRSNDDWRALIYSADLRRVDNEWADAIARHAPFEIEFRVRRPKEGIRWLLSKGQAQYGQDGQPTRLSGITMDITQLRQLRLERDEAFKAMERLSAHIQDDMESLRRELAMEVHDEIGASLTGIRIQLEVLKQESQGRKFATDKVAGVLGLVDQAFSRSRALCTRLRPPMLDDLGLVETCRWYLADWSRNSGIVATGRFRALAGPIPDALRTDMFRIFQELLTNVARHSAATRVNVSLGDTAAGLRLRVRDNGKGFASDEPAGFGIPGIRERIRRHQGTLDIDSAAGGTVLTVQIPVRP